MAKRRPKFGFETWTSNDRMYGHCYIEITPGEVLDAAKQYDAEPTNYRLDRLVSIRDNGGSVKYFSESSDGKLRIRFQCDGESNRWYACTLDRADFSSELLRLASKLAETIGWYGQPSEVIAKLLELGAVPVSAKNMPTGALRLLDEAPEVVNPLTGEAIC